MEKSKLRPIYSEFQGYLSQIPQPKVPHESLDDDSLWNQYNNSVDLLNKISGEDYSRFKIQPLRDQIGNFIRVVTYRQKLGGLISYLHGKYFSDETPPFSGMPTTVIHQSQHQNQSMQLVLEFQEQIIKRMADYPDGTNEKKFLQKIKDSLGSISTWTQLIAQVYKSAKDLGLDIDMVGSIFGIK